MICHTGGAIAIVDYINDVKGNARLPGIITLGYISAFDESLAIAVIAAKGIAPLKDALIKEPGITYLTIITFLYLKIILIFNLIFFLFQMTWLKLLLHGL